MIVFGDVILRNMTYSVYEKAEEKGWYFRLRPIYKALRKARWDNLRKFALPFPIWPMLFFSITYFYTVSWLLD